MNVERILPVRLKKYYFKGIEFSWRLNFLAPLTHEFLRFHGDLIMQIGKFQNSLRSHRFWQKKHHGRKRSLMTMFLTRLQ